MSTLLPSSNKNASSLKNFKDYSGAIASLSAEKEIELGRRHFEDGDHEAGNELILTHMRVVMRIASQFKGYGLPESELIQEGSIGLTKAVRRFDPKVGVRLVSFASHWIRAEMLDYILKNWRIVKIATTKSQRKLFFNLRAHRQSISHLTRTDYQEISDKLSVSHKDIKEMERRFYCSELSFDAAISDSDENEDTFCPEHFVESPDSDISVLCENQNLAHHNSEKLKSAMECLSERDQDIIRLRWLTDKEDKPKLRELAAKYEVSPERVRQLEAQSIAKLKTKMALH